MLNDAHNGVSGYVDQETGERLNGRYIVQLIAMEPMEDGQFGARVRWVFQLAQGGKWLLDAKGQAYRFFQQTSTKMGPKATARGYATALLGREIEEGEPGASIVDAMLGKSAYALISQNEAGYDTIVKMTPYTPPASQQAPPARQPNEKSGGPTAAPQEPPESVPAGLPAGEVAAGVPF